MHMKCEAARLLIWRAAANAQDGLPSILDSSTAKCFANSIAREVAGDAMQLMGAYGYSKEFPMERRLRDSWGWGIARSEEHTSELQSLMRISYAVFCLKKKKKTNTRT